MLWLIIIIVSYFLFALVSLGDKYLLVGPPNPKSYTFYVGLLGGLVLVLIPFVGFSLVPFSQFLLCLLAGAVFLFALFGLYQGLEHFEASRIIPAVGGLLPLFTIVLTYFFFGERLGGFSFLAFVFLVLGSILVSIERGKRISFKSFKISFITALLLSLSFVLAKYVYLLQPFWTGFIWIRVGTLITALFFLFSKDIRRELFGKKLSFTRKTGALFVSNQAVGAGAFILQHWAIALAGLAYLAVINALQGVQYVFLLVFAILISLKSPQFLKEKISKGIVIKKVLAILLIGIGLIILVLL